jgi:AAA+ superfamily predicted ATPase
MEELQDTPLLGKFHNAVCFKCVSLIKHQYDNHITDGIKGVLFHGVPGNGKTTTAFKIIERVFAAIGDGQVWQKHMIFTDCGHLAHHKYGETEQRIKNVFKRGQEMSNKISPMIYMFDDADGLFITRDWGVKLEAWYLGHLNVFFHQIDNLNTAKEFIILTSNRADLIDVAIRDRLYEIEFPDPSMEVKIELMKYKAKKLKINEEIQKLMEKTLRENLSLKSLRDVENFVLMKYLDEVWKTEGNFK